MPDIFQNSPSNNTNGFKARLCGCHHLPGYPVSQIDNVLSHGFQTSHGGFLNVGERFRESGNVYG